MSNNENGKNGAIIGSQGDVRPKPMPGWLTWDNVYKVLVLITIIGGFFWWIYSSTASKNELELLRQEMREDFKEVRDEMRGDFGQIRNEMREDAATVRDDIREVRQDIRSLMNRDRE